MMSKTAVLLLGAMAVAGTAVASESYTVNKVVGTALSTQEGVVVPVKAGMVLVDGQTLTTAARSTLVVTLKSGCTFTIQPSTTFVVNSSQPCNVSIAQAGSVRLAQLGAPTNPVLITQGTPPGLGGLGGIAGTMGPIFGAIGVPALGRSVELNVYNTPTSP